MDWYEQWASNDLHAADACKQLNATQIVIEQLLENITKSLCILLTYREHCY